MLNKSEYLQVARLHSSEISGGFLSTLGVRFLALLYEGIDQSDGCVLLVARENGRIVGFVAGANGLGPVYRKMLKAWWRLIFALTPACLSPRKIYRICETVFFSAPASQSGIELPRSELLSIAVHKDFRGRGVADMLFKNLVAHFREKNVGRFKIIVGDGLAPAHKFYVKSGAYPAARVEVHKGRSSLVYLCDVF